MCVDMVVEAYGHSPLIASVLSVKWEGMLSVENTDEGTDVDDFQRETSM